jgi:hypothetical protein
MTRVVLRSAAPALILAACLLLPFHDKAFTIDDPIFLLAARNAVADPLHPTAFDIAWHDAPERVGPTFALMSWLLVPAVLSDKPESVAHVIELLFFWLALLATVSLAIRLGSTPHWAMAAGLLLAATPVALGMAGTAMADLPAMALGVSGLERLVAWKQERRLHQALLAALLLGLAPFARPHTALLLGIGSLLLVGDFLSSAGWRATKPVDWFPLAGAALAIASLLVLIRDPVPTAPSILAGSKLTLSVDRVGPNAVAFATHWTLFLPLALPWTLLRPREVLRRWWVLLAGGGAAFLVLSVAHRASIPNAALAGVGIAVLWDILADGWSRRDAVQLGLGLWLLLPLVAVPYPHFPAKYNLLAAPAAVLLVARLAAQRGGVLAKLGLGGTAVLGVALGVAVLRADAAFADLGRRAAAELIAPQVARGHRVWFLGHWGFHWYAERAGARTITVTPPYPRPGDLVVSSLNSDKGNHLMPMVRRDFRFAYLRHLEDRTPGGRVMTEGAGFFSNNSGYLPWAWGTDVLDLFVLWRVDWARHALPP